MPRTPSENKCHVRQHDPTRPRKLQLTTLSLADRCGPLPVWSTVFGIPSSTLYTVSDVSSDVKGPSEPFSPDPFRPQLASDAATDALRSAIMRGALKPGQRLKEAEIAELLTISRTPIRHAIQTLEKEGLIETVPHRGARVSSYSSADLDEMYDLRALLEGRGAELAAGRINSAQLAVLYASSDRFDHLSAGDDVDALVAENMLFHTTVLEAAGSDRLGAMLRTVVAVPLVYQAYAWFSAEDKHCSERAHRDLVEALSARDASSAGAIMRKHLLDSRDVLLARMHDQLGEANGSAG